MDEDAHAGGTNTGRGDAIGARIYGCTIEDTGSIARDVGREGARSLAPDTVQNSGGRVKVIWHFIRAWFE